MFGYKGLQHVQGERNVDAKLRQQKSKRRESYVSELLAGLHKFDLQVKEDIKKMQMAVKDSKRKHSGKKDKKKRLSCDDTLVEILQSSLDWQQQELIMEDENSEHKDKEREKEANEKDKRTKEEIISTSGGITVVRKRKLARIPSSSSGRNLERRNSWSSSKDLFTVSMDLSHWKVEQPPKFVPSSREFDSKNRLWSTALKITETHHQLDMGHWSDESQWDKNGHPRRKAFLVHKMAKLRQENNSVIVKRSKTRKEDNNNKKKNKSNKTETLMKEESFSEGLTGLSQVFGPKQTKLMPEESFSEGLDGFSKIWNS